MKRETGNWRVLSAVLTAVAVIVAVLAVGCLPQSSAQGASGLDDKETVEVFVGALSAEANAGGRVLPQREAVLSFSAPGRVQRLPVEVGDRVVAGQVLVQLEMDALQRAVRNAEQNLAIQQANLAELAKGASAEDIAAAEASVASAEAQVADVLAGPTEIELADAEASLASARVQLDDLLAGPSQVELAQAQASLASAQAASRAAAARHAASDDQILVARQQLALAEVDLKNARYFYDALANDWQHKEFAPFSPEASELKDAQTAYGIALARFNLSLADINDSAYRSAQAQVAQAEARLAALVDEPVVEIASAREQLEASEANLAALLETSAAQVASARASLAQAEARLATLLDGASAERVAMTKAQVEQAKLRLADAQDRLADASLVAPFDGVVTAGPLAFSDVHCGPAIELVDDSSLQVVLDVDEVDIADIGIGQHTILTLEAWPDRELSGLVVALAPKARAQSEVVTYEVHIDLDPEGLPLRTGMTANADLITSRRESVLLIANRAITADRDAGTYYVYRVEGDSVERVEVTIGLRDGSYSEVTSGLREGDELVVGYVEASLEFGPGQGGSFGGSGPFGGGGPFGRN